MTNREKVMIMESWSGLVKEHPGAVAVVTRAFEVFVDSSL